MKPYVFLLLILSTGSYKTAVCQLSKISGYIVVFNSKTETGQMRYGNGAKVEDVLHRANSYLTKNDGAFVLELIGVKEKESVEILVTKPGWEIVNTDKLDAVAGQDEPLKLLIAPIGKIADARANYYNIGVTEGTKVLNWKISKLQDELDKRFKQDNKDSATIANLNQQIIILNKQKNTIGDQAEEFAERYSKLNLDDASPDFLKALDFYKRGYIDSALNLLHKIDFKNKLDSIGNVLRLTSIRQQSYFDLLELQGDLYANKFQLDSAIFSYQLLLQYDSLNIRIRSKYAFSLKNANKTKEALSEYQKGILILNDHPGLSSQGSFDYIYGLYINAGVLFFEQQDIETGRSYALKAVELLCKTILTDSSEHILYLLGLATSDFAMMFYDYESENIVSDYLGQAKRIYSRLLLSNYRKYALQYANILNMIALSDHHSKKLEQSKLAFLEAIRIIDSSANDISTELFVEKIRILTGLGDLYYTIGDTAKSDSTLVLAYSLTNKYKINFKNPLDWAIAADAFESLGRNRINSNKKTAYNLLKGACDIYSWLTKQDSSKYIVDLVQTIVGLAHLFKVEHNFIDAANHLDSSIAILENLENKNNGRWVLDIAKIKLDLGSMYVEIDSLKKAEETLNQALEIFQYLANSDPYFKSYVDETKQWLDRVYEKKNNPTQK